MKHFIWMFILTFALIGCATADDQIVTEVLTNTPKASSTPIPTATYTLVPPTATSTDTPPPPTITKQTTEVADPLANYPDEGYGPVKFPENINPLTGLPVKDAAILDRRPVAIKISNEQREIRPQWGLSLADLVFEYYHEYGEARFHAIFYGNDADEVGPIRSARFPDEHLIKAYKSVFAFGGADYRVRWRLFSSDFSNRLATFSDRPCPPTTEYPTCRIEPEGWNHLMTDTSVLSQYFTDQNISNDRQYLDGMRFNKIAPPDGDTVNSLIVRFSKSHYHKWEYDQIGGRFQRYDDSSTDTGEGETFEPLMDRANDQPIAADNVVVIFAPYSFFSRDPEMIEINLIGSGKAYVLRDGQVFDVYWARVNADEIISLTYEDGSRFPLKPGSTWFSIVGNSSTLEQSSSDWHIQFLTP